MNEITLNSALLSLNQNLNDPGPLVDGRTVEDNLSFLANFGRLLNFYNKENEQNGSWEPFILKDPVFLVASIGQVDAVDRMKLYRNSCAQCLVKANNEDNSTDLSSLNPLFNQLFQVFGQIQKWSDYMVNSSLEYGLKTFTINSIRSSYVSLFQAFLNLSRELCLSNSFTGIQSFDQEFYTLFEGELWKVNGGTDPYWEILGLQSPLSDNNLIDFINSFQNEGTQILDFYLEIVIRSENALVELNAEKSSHPDTLLLRTFIELLKVNQDDLNGLTTKHLDFYYTRILKQKKRNAKPDSVFVCANLAIKDRTFKLLQGTTFSAGLDDNKEPVLFELQKDQILNPANIVSARTLFVSKPIGISANPNVPVDNDLSKLVTPIDGETLLVNQHKDLDVLKKDENGVTLAWDTFGSSNTQVNQKQELGIAFASPLLLMNEGVRNLKVQFEFTEAIKPQLFQTAHCFLSTKKSWFSITPEVPNSDDVPDTVQSFTLSFKLNSADPPIEKFEKNPDGYESEWPLFKLTFGMVDDLSNPPMLSKLVLTTDVEQVKSLVIGNDNGALNAGKPFMPFGPVVAKNSSFYIGSAEIFSKPLSFLSFNFKWDKLPKNFGVYYGLYNAYLNHLLVPAPAGNGSKVGAMIKGITKSNFGLKLIGNLIKDAFKKAKEEIAEEGQKKLVLTEFFSNSSFTVGFEQLSNHQWNTAPLDRNASCSYSNDVFTCEPPPIIDAPSSPVSLFNQTDDKSGILAPEIAFSYHKTKGMANPLTYNPSLQGRALQLNEQTADGFIRLNLSNPEHGFGHDVYPKVISQVTLVNAENLIAKAKGNSGGDNSGATDGDDKNANEDVELGKDLPLLLPTPNPPFAPILKSISASYQASASYDFHYQTSSDPIECFHYSLFNNYLVYDSSRDSGSYQENIGIPLCGPKKMLPYLPIFAGFDYDAVLYLELENVIAGNQATVFIELNQSANPQDQSGVSLNYFYLSDSVWNSLELVHDETKGFKCSGNMTFEFPSDMNANNLQTPGNYWIGITLTGNPDLIGKTTFLKTNGMVLKRVGSEYLDDTESPQIPANIITSPAKTIPEISELVQPFASFGGGPQESNAKKNRRVANRLKIKGRPITVNDFNRCIRQDFNSIFYSKVNFDKSSRTVFIRLVKKIESALTANAFLPMVSACEEEEIGDTLKQLSGIEELKVKNFEIEYLIVNTTVYIQPEYDVNSASNRITQALKVFLSPWIKSSQDQLTIDQGVTDAQIAAFLTGFQEVSGVDDISFQLAEYNNGQKIYDDSLQTQVNPKNPAVLLVPNMTQRIEWKKAV